MPDFVHPIIQAVIASSQMKRQAQDSATAKEQNDKDRTLRQQELNERIKRDDQQYALQQKQFDNAVKQLQSQMEAADLHRKMQGMEAVNKGFVKPVDVPSIQGVGGASGIPSFNIPSGQQSIPGFNMTVPAGSIATPEELGKRRIQEAADAEKARLTAQEPFKIADDKRIAELRAQQDAASQVRLLTGKAEDDKRVMELEQFRQNNENYRAELAAKVRLQSQAPEFTSEDVDGYRTKVLYEGLPVTAVPVKIRTSFVNSIKSEKMLDKADIAVTKAYPKAKEVISILDELSTVGSTLSGRASAITGLSFGTKGESGATAAGLKTQLKATSAELAKILGESSSRISDQDRKFVLDLYNQVGSEADNKAAATRLKNILAGSLTGITAPMKEDQKKEFLLRFNIDANDLKVQDKPKKDQGKQKDTIINLTRDKDGKLVRVP